MGGKEAIKGFMYQGFMAVLEALTNNYWDKIYVEYPTEGDKVDIALEAKGKIINSIQVKSSINLFKKSSISKWIEQLVFDVKSCEYQISLIGSCDKEATIFMNSLDKYKNNIKDYISEESLKDFDTDILDNNKITIKILPNDEVVLQSIVRDALNKYISYKGYILDYVCLDLLAQATITTQMLLGTKGKSISKNELDKKIFDWINIVSGNSLKKVEKQAEHELKFYDQDSIVFQKEMVEFNIVDYCNNKKFINLLKQETNNLIEEINKIILPKYEVQEYKEKLSSTKLDNIIKSAKYIDLEPIKNKLLDNKSIILPDLLSKSAEIEDEEKEKLIKDIKSILDIDISYSFFYVGNLKEKLNYINLGQTYLEYIGNELEKKKNSLIIKLRWNLCKLELIDRFINTLNSYSVVPFVIQNKGDTYDKNLTIKIFINKLDVKLFQCLQYKRNYFVTDLTEIFCQDDGILSEIFELQEDKNVGIENKVFFNNLPINLFGQTKYSAEDFYDKFDKYIAKISYEDDSYYIIEYEIEELRPKECKWLNPLILLHCINIEVKIKYEIMSNNTDGHNNGILKIYKK